MVLTYSASLMKIIPSEAKTTVKSDRNVQTMTRVRQKVNAAV